MPRPTSGQGVAPAGDSWPRLAFFLDTQQIQPDEDTEQ